MHHDEDQSMHLKVNHVARCMNGDRYEVVPNLKKKIREDWKDAEQSCVIHLITYDSDHLMVESFNISSSG